MRSNGNQGGFVKIGALALSGLIVLSALPVQSQAAEQAKPGPEHKKLEMWAGEFRHEGNGEVSPFSPVASEFKGTISARIALGGFFVHGESRDMDEHGNFFHAIWLMGYDEKEKAYFLHGYEADGTHFRARGQASGHIWTFTSTRMDGEGKEYMWKMVMSFSSDGRTHTEVSEYSADDGKTWATMYRAKMTKVSP